MENKLLLGITGWKKKHWKEKIDEIEALGVTRVSLFLERFELKDRLGIYDRLMTSNIKDIPLVHIRHDMIKEEIDILFNNYNSRYFTIHEDHFDILNKWRGYYKYLYLEMNADNYISEKVNVKKIGGFCVDLSHYKKAEVKDSQEYHYTLSRKNTKRYFPCNHLNGYSYKLNKDLHRVRSLKSFEYLKTLPSFLFGEVIGIETDNSIKDQLKFKAHILKILKNIHPIK